MSKLQHVQNCAAKLVMKQRIPAGEMDGVLLSLHWIKVRYRCIFKLLVIVHNCLHGAAPVEIMSLLQCGDSIRTMNLRETNYSNKFGVRAFSHVDPELWNLLPKSVRDIIDIFDFKKALKTFLMTRGDEYCCWLSRK